ncbi:MAG: four helix bundle protein [Opitutaceae bacterium]|nr:four helix bundle protein [Opitutaceae bacterium]
MPERDKLKSFGAYQKALELFDHVVADLEPLLKSPALYRLISQQYASADSVASNMEEGYGRESQRDFAHFLVISRGSAQETAGRYQRLKHWLPADVIAKRVALCGETIGILSASIKTLRSDG